MSWIYFTNLKVLLKIWNVKSLFRIMGLKLGTVKIWSQKKRNSSVAERRVNVYYVVYDWKARDIGYVFNSLHFHSRCFYCPRGSSHKRTFLSCLSSPPTLLMISSLRKQMSETRKIMTIGINLFACWLRWMEGLTISLEKGIKNGQISSVDHNNMHISIILWCVYCVGNADGAQGAGNRFSALVISEKQTRGTQEKSCASVDRS